MKQKPGMVTQTLSEDEIMVVPTEGTNVNRILNLNGSGGYVWKLLETERTFDEIVSLLVEEYGVSAAEAGNDLTEFISAIQAYIE